MHKKEIETVIRAGRVLGFRCRSWVIFGIVQEAPVGWVIGRRQGDTIVFERRIYKNRQHAADALEVRH